MGVTGENYYKKCIGNLVNEKNMDNAALFLQKYKNGNIYLTTQLFVARMMINKNLVMLWTTVF